MDDLHRQISDLIEEEHRLRSAPATDASRSELSSLETRLDQLWDLMRQRDARRDAGQDPSGAHERPATEVEGYLQ